MGPVAFSAVTAVSPVAEHRFAAEIHPEWTVGGRPNGGYLLAVLARAALARSPHQHVVTASALYLRAPAPGLVSIEVEVLRVGRSASQLRARMVQDTPCVEALITTAELDPDAEQYWAGGVPVRSTAAPESAVRVPATNPAGSRVTIMDQVELSLEPASFGFRTGRPAGKGELWGWLRLPGDEPFDPVALLYAVDAFPPASFDVEPTGWVPTLGLTCYVRALPAPGPVQVLHKANLIAGQRVDEVCWVWDSRGRVVAHGTQLAGIRLG